MKNSKFDKYVKQTISVEVDGEEIEMYPIQADIAKIMGSTGPEGEVTEKGMEVWMNVMTHMIARENLPNIHFTNKKQGGKYPYYQLKENASEEEEKEYQRVLKGIENFVALKAGELLQKVPVEFGWASKKKMKNKIDDLEKKG